MATRPTKGIPETAIAVRNYADYLEYVRGFADGRIKTLVVIGSPGLSKSKAMKLALADEGIEVPEQPDGKTSTIKFVQFIEEAEDGHLILDDIDMLWKNAEIPTYVKKLTELEKPVTIRYDTRGNETLFETSSPVAIILNAWSSKDHILRAIESRAVVIHFCPSTAEVYKYAASWFWDQEILDYFYERIELIPVMDLRRLVTAAMLKRGGIGWRDQIDVLCHKPDEAQQLLEKLLRDKAYKTNDARMKVWTAKTGMDRATFYRRLDKLRDNVTEAKPSRVILRSTRRRA